MKKILLIILLLSSLISINANQISDKEYSYGYVKQGDCISWRQGYANSTYTNFTSITYPNKTQIFFNPNIAADAYNGEYNYLACGYSNELGEYEVCSVTDVDGIDVKVCNNYLVTPSGKAGTENIVFFVFVIIMLYTITFLGFFGRNIPLTILGGMAMVGLGLYTIRNGIIIYRDWLTNYFSYVTLAIGAVLALWALIEWIQETLS